MSESTNVAIACQGGGSHSAFTAGVLQEFCERWDDELGDRYALVGFSGASGGAFNALAAWYACVTGAPGDAVGLLDGLWDDLSATDGGDRLLNEWLVGVSRIESAGFPVPSVSPYQLPGDRWGKQRIRDALERHLDFAAIPELCERTAPELVVGTVNVNAGTFETFRNEDVTVDAVLASAAIPALFEAVELHGHAHWDGLFSQNPPISDLMAVPDERRPEELWIVQVNPQTRDGTPSSLDVIADRRNELSGNLSLNQELRFVEMVNGWIDEGYLPEGRFTHTEVRRIEMGQQYHCSTKLDRSPGFIGELKALGRERAAAFLDERDPD